MKSEETLRQELGIPAGASRILILSQSAHLDWDWLLPFPVLLDNDPTTTTSYFPPDSETKGPAATIFTAAGTMLTANGQSPYYYSICEIGFLRGFANKYPAEFANLTKAGTNLHIVGGGITSPDNLLPAGEAFIRNYLIGKLWVDANLQLPMKQAWLPDDFGHDSQLPVLLSAMGFQGVGFQRVPGTGPDWLTPVDGSLSVAAQLYQNCADFIWQAADGSTVLAHWLVSHQGDVSGGYCQGDILSDQGYQAISKFIETNQPASPTPFIFVPVGCDFRMPQDLPSFASQWNSQSPPPEVYAVAATFDDYIQLISSQPLKTLTSFNPVPYFTGCYAMRPAIKRLHHRTTRALLTTEIYSLLASAAALSSPPASTSAAIDDVWNDLSPSTHHDYITGTAISPVYTGEQIPLLLKAHDESQALLTQTLEEVAAAVATQPQSPEIPVIVFNPLGIPNNSLVRIPPVASLATFGIPEGWSVRDSAGNSFPAQPTSDGSLLFPASIPSLGYAAYYVSPADQSPPQNPVTHSVPDNDPTGITLANNLIQFTVAGSANWAITEIYDLSASPPTNILTGAANDLVFYDEGIGSTAGDNYRFGNEKASGTLNRSPTGLTGVSGELVEHGPLRARILTTAVFVEPNTNTSFIYTREYILHCNEPFIRMRTVGAAPFAPGDTPTGYSVVATFPLANAIAGITHGTTYHWSDLPQVRYWAEGPAFQATHDFVIASDDQNNVLGAVYHSWVNAWGQTTADDLSSNTLLGCVLRNPAGSYFNWFTNVEPPDGTDPGVHTLEYAFRVPTGLGSPASGAPLAESLQFQAPMRVVVPPIGSSGSLQETFSLASVSSSDETQAFITVAKLGSADPSQFIFRIYQPSNNTTTPPTLTVSLEGLAQLLGASSLTATAVTALEAAIEGASALPATPNFDFAATAALTTFAVTA